MSEEGLGALVAARYVVPRWGRICPQLGGKVRRNVAIPLCVAASVLLSACDARLPEPDSAGAQLYAARCDGCHRLFAPRSLTFEMWKVQVERMQGDMVRQGLPPLTPQERDLVLDYLKRYSQ
jgi:hypothetical protein